MVVFTKANGGSIVLSNEILAAAAAESLDDDVELNLHGLLEALELDVQNRCYQLARDEGLVVGLTRTTTTELNNDDNNDEDQMIFQTMVKASSSPANQTPCFFKPASSFKFCTSPDAPLFPPEIADDDVKKTSRKASRLKRHKSKSTEISALSENLQGTFDDDISPAKFDKKAEKVSDEKETKNTVFIQDLSSAEAAVTRLLKVVQNEEEEELGSNDPFLLTAERMLGNDEKDPSVITAALMLAEQI